MADARAQAMALVTALRESPEWARLQRLAGTVKADPQGERLIAEYRLKQLELQSLALQGQLPSRELQAAFQGLGAQIQAHPVLREYMAAEQAYGRLLDELRQVLSAVFQPDVPGAIRPQ